MNKKYFLYAIIPALVLASIGGVAVYAQNATGNNSMQDLVAKIAQRFNLNQNDVQAVFDEQKTEMHANMQTKFAEKLSQAVTDGKITQAEADAITAKREELQVKRPNMANGEKPSKELMQAHQTELKQWVTDNNIPIEYVMGFGGGKMGAKGQCPMGNNPVE